MQRLIFPGWWHRRVRYFLFELATATVWTIVGLATLLDGDTVLTHSPLGHELRYYPTVWGVLYLVGGPAVIYGVMKPHLGVRVAGLTLLATGLAMQGVAAVWTHPGLDDLRVLNYFVYCAACAIRAYCVSGVARTVLHGAPAQS